MRINIADKDTLERVLQRKKWFEPGKKEVDLKAMLKTILMWANEFVPSESGSILLDDPVFHGEGKKAGNLYFVASYGKGSEKLSGTALPDDIGIVGQTYGSAKPYISQNVKTDKVFYSKIDEQTKFVTRSIICAPIDINGVAIGVIELINRVGDINYVKKDLTLLEVFAGYTSTLIQNSLDAKRFGDMSVRDNLTGLYNDRFFFDFMEEQIKKSMKQNKDLSLLFLDLDRFKEINDTYGHLAGSQLLHELGLILADIAINTNIIPIRYGGDEFIIILPKMEITESTAFVESLKNKISNYTFLSKANPGTLKNLNISDVITCSIGVATLRTNVKKRKSAKDMREALIKQSDRAMYSAKGAGKNRVVVAKGKI